MLPDCDCNLIAEYRTIDQVLPYAQYKSGAKDNDKPVYGDDVKATSNPILALEFDILNKDGYGLKRGYYELAVDETYSFLMFVQSNTIKAKIPIVAHEVIEKSGSDFEWADDKDKNTPNTASKNLDGDITIASKKTYRKVYTDKELKKRKKKYQKGMDPSLHFHSKAAIEYDREHDLYKVIWEKYNTRFVGVIKI